MTTLYDIRNDENNNNNNSKVITEDRAMSMHDNKQTARRAENKFKHNFFAVFRHMKADSVNRSSVIDYNP